MSGLKKPIYVEDRRARTYIERLISFLGGKDEVDKKLTKVNAQLRLETGVFRQNWVVPRTIWWKGLEAARTELDKNWTLRGAISSIMEYPLQTAGKLSFLFRSLSPEKRNDLQSRILRQKIIEPVIFEIDTAAHFVQLGYAISWFQAGKKEGERTPEFTATRDGVEIEVECKAKQADSGRMIDRAIFYRLVDRLIPILTEKRASGNVVLTVPERLPKHDKWFKEVVSSLEEAIIQGQVTKNLADGASFQLDLRTEAEKKEKYSEFLSRIDFLKNPYSHFAFSGLRQGDMIINPLEVRLDSKKKDKFLDSVMDSLADANRQFTGKRAAVISCFLPEIDSFEGLQSDSAIQAMTNSFFEKHARPCVYAVSFASETRREVHGNVIDSDMPSLTFYNPMYEKTFGVGMQIYGDSLPPTIL